MYLSRKFLKTIWRVISSHRRIRIARVDDFRIGVTIFLSSTPEIYNAEEIAALNASPRVHLKVDVTDAAVAAAGE